MLVGARQNAILVINVVLAVGVFIGGAVVFARAGARRRLVAHLRSVQETSLNAAALHTFATYDREGREIAISPNAKQIVLFVLHGGVDQEGRNWARIILALHAPHVMWIALCNRPTCAVELEQCCHPVKVAVYANYDTMRYMSEFDARGRVGIFEPSMGALYGVSRDGLATRLGH